MSVVLRCPTCGTTQGHAGECEACSDGDVRYFCTNHDEGIWLDGPVCNRCGRKFGQASSTPPAPRAPSVPTPPTRAPDFRPPGRRRAPGPPRVDDGRTPPRRPEREMPADPEVRPRTPRGGFPIGGCLIRIVGLVFLVITVVIVFLLMLFGGFIVD